MTAPNQGRDPYARAMECEARLPRLLEIAKAHAGMMAAQEVLAKEIEEAALDLRVESDPFDVADNLAEIARRLRNVQAS